MMKIGVLILFAVSIFSFPFKIDGLVDGIKVDGISRQNENTDRGHLIESFGSPNSYEEGPLYANINPFLNNNMIKRSSIDRNTGRRQTGIIYGDGKPIGILQPYEESFKFMPIKEEKVYALDGGRSDLNEQEPYLNLMYPLARFARSEDALKMAEYEAARAEFLEKHYPSMLVDFKIRDKLHANRAKSTTHQDVKREEQKSGDVEKFEQKRQLELENRKTGKRESESAQKQLTHKREAEKPSKRVAQIDQTADTSKRDAENSQNDEKNASKRDTEIFQKAKAKSPSKIEENTGQSRNLAPQNQIKKKRENRLTDAEFDRLRNTISKRNSVENVDMIENDLRGLLNDMGLIEDDLEENADEMEKVRSVMNEEINSDEAVDNPVLSKEKNECSSDQDDYKTSIGRKKRLEAKSVANEEAEDSSNSDADMEQHVDRKRSNSNSPIDEKRVIDVNFITKTREDKQLTAPKSEPEENRLRASDIPNKREAPVAAAFHGKDRKKSMVKSKIDEAGLSTTESYAQYEERVAREIKNKIEMLKEEVKKELGALEEDNDEEDEDEESVGEPQRKKRFIANTLLDEEVNNIDPNSNAESAELQPHVRRRRMLSTDMLEDTRNQKEPLNLKESVNFFAGHGQLDSMYNKENFERDSRNFPIEGDNSKTLPHQGKSEKENTLKYLGVNNDENFQFEDEAKRKSWVRPHLHLTRSRDFYFPQFEKRSSLNYIPWNAVQKGARNLNTGVYSYESESEGNSDSRRQPESKSNVELDTSKKTQQFKYNSQPFPKDRTVENPGYYVYYIGKNQKNKLENPQTSQIQSRKNRPMNYQQMRMAYPQFYDNVNVLQNKEQYMMANNDDENQKSMTFRIMYKVPSGRRRKRQITRNFFLPFKDTEDAIVTNTLSEYVPRYEIPNNKRKNSTSSNSDPTNKNLIDGGSSRSFDLKGINNNEKGKEGFSKGDNTGIDALDLNIDFTEIKSERTTDNYRNTTFYQITPEEDKNMKKNEYSDQVDWKNNYTSKYLLESSNLSIYKSMPTVKQMENNQKYSLKSIDLSSKSNDNIKINSRRILSTSINNEQTTQFQNVDNTTYSLDNYHFSVEKKKKLLNSNDDFFGSKIFEPQNDMEYEAVLSEIPMESSTNEEHLKTIKNRVINTTSSRELPNLTDENYIFKPPPTEKFYESAFFGKLHRVDNFSNYLSEKSELIGDKLDKNTLYLSNDDYSPAESKRRKRDIRFTPENRDNVRKKRLNWFWPIKSSFARSGQQNEEYDQFEPNEVSDSGKDNSVRFKDSSAGVDSNYEDLNADVGDYERKKRQQNSFSPVFSGKNQKTYSYAGNPRLHYVPESRARRYVSGWYREPHRELLTDMSDVELFGALPQSYAGELNRYKRVKRGKWSRY